MARKVPKNRKIKQRDANILASLSREISLNERVVRSKRRYTRKIKHKNASDGT